MNKDQVKGRYKEAEGKVKEATGKAIGNPTLEIKGQVENAVGNIQAGYGDRKDALKKGK